MRATKKVIKQRIKFIKNNLHIGNIELAKMLNITVWNVAIIFKRYKIKRPKNIVRAIRLMASQKGSEVVHKLYKFDGENNPNWKGGISTDTYRYKKIQQQRYPERIAARKKVYYAVKVGNLIRMPCEICGTTPSFAHHKDYSRPLDVEWLCRKHHREQHDNKH